jgi:excisionase family DNA binding protein
MSRTNEIANAKMIAVESRLNASAGEQMNAIQIEMEDRLLTVAEAARFLNLAPGSLYHLVSQHRIPVIRLSRRCIRFRRQSLLAWIEGLTQTEDHRR